MDADVLIAAVFKRTPIWDKKHKLHKNRNVIEKLWKEICYEMNEDENKLRKKWKYLRDQFSVELGKVFPPRAGDSAEDTPLPKWMYFNQLMFLKDAVKPRATSGNLSHLQKSIQETQGEDTQSSVGFEERYKEPTETGEVENNYVTSLPQITTPNQTPTLPKKRRGAIDKFIDSILVMERQKVDYINAKTKRNASEEEDEHLFFFKSILPHVKKIPESQILSFRCRVQELVDQYLNL